MKEKNIQTSIMLALSKIPGCRVFRNNVANAVAGNIQEIKPGSIVAINGRQFRAEQGTFLVTNGRRIQCGLCPGSTDLIGWVSLEVTGEMVGQQVALFLAPEIKAEKGRLRENQEHFIETVRAAGGISGVVRSEEEAVSLVVNRELF